MKNTPPLYISWSARDRINSVIADDNYFSYGEAVARERAFRYGFDPTRGFGVDDANAFTIALLLTRFADD